MSLDLDSERTLALAYVPRALRPAVEALWRLDVALGAVVARAGDPMVSRIRLAWWRDSLERLDREPPPAEPVLEAVAAHILPAGVGGAELAETEEGWAVLLAPGPLGPDDLDVYAAARGGRLFLHTARLLGETDPAVAAAGEKWALVDLARHSADEADVRAALDAARSRAGPAVWPVTLRPLGMLAALARRDARTAGALEAPGSPARILRMLRHRLTGR